MAEQIMIRTISVGNFLVRVTEIGEFKGCVAG